MKYFSILFALLILAGCGKKTDPISKDSIEKTTPPSAFVLRAENDGFYIRNNEQAVLVIEKGISQDGACASFSLLKKLAPKEEYKDTDVSAGSEYVYRFSKTTLKYKLTSAPVSKIVFFSVPPVVLSAAAKADNDNVLLSITPSSPFVRMDILSEGKIVTTTGKEIVGFARSELSGSTINIKLTDEYGNTGKVFTLDLSPKVKLAKPKNILAVFAGSTLRIVWDAVKGAASYNVELCTDVSCETINTNFAVATFQKEFDKCVYITVNAVSPDAVSEKSGYRFCK